MDSELLHRRLSSGMVMASRHWRRACQDALAGHAISEACAAPLLALARLGDGARQVTLAHEVGVECASLVRLLDQLGSLGYVRREADSADRRAKTLWLTESGRALVTSIEAQLGELRRQVLADLPQEDLQAALRVLQAFADAPGRLGK